MSLVNLAPGLHFHSPRRPTCAPTEDPTLDWKKIAPWNWFKHEESHAPATLAAPAGFNASSDPFAAVRMEMERLFDDSVGRSFLGVPSRLAVPGRIPVPLRPSVDISEGKKAYTVRADLPGVERGDVSVEVKDNTLMVRAEKRQESEEEDEGYHCVERSYGAAQRVLSLPDDADGEAIEAKFKDGVLKLRIPKHPARASRGRTIEIHAG